MIQYHGVGGGGSLRDNLKHINGRHAFVSFSRHKRLGALAQVCQSFALDNGAFSAWKTGKEFNFDGVVGFVDKWRRHPAFDFCVIPDKIDGTEKENDLLLEAWPFKNDSAPVWHYHESIKRLEKLVEESAKQAKEIIATSQTQRTKNEKRFSR